jgi:hypothetical protein
VIDKGVSIVAFGRFGFLYVVYQFVQYGYRLFTKIVLEYGIESLIQFFQLYRMLSLSFLPAPAAG